MIYVKMHKPENRAYIQRVQQILDHESPNFKQFQSTGLFIPREEYEEVDDVNTLHPECQDVVWYAMGGNIIQGLKSGYFIASCDGIHKRSKTLEVVEKFIYENKIK